MFTSEGEHPFIYESFEGSYIMIHFSERVKINNEFYKWLEKKNEELKEEGYVVKDTNITFLIFLYEKGLLNEDAIHKEYERR